MMRAVVFVALLTCSAASLEKPRRLALVSRAGEAGAAVRASSSDILAKSIGKAAKATKASWTRRQDQDLEALAYGKRVSSDTPDHFLTDSELKNTSSVPCLQLKQQNPAIRCDGTSSYTRDGYPLDGKGSGFNIGSYPHWKDSKCHSHDDYFCDPDNLLDDKDRAALVDELRSLRNTTQVTCGQLQNDTVDNRHFETFFLGVAIAGSSWQGGLDSDSLETFGRVLASQWQLNKIQTGPEMLYTTCPNVAMLLLFPGSRRAFVSSPSCEFICQDRGGPEVTSVTLTAFDAGGIVAGIRAGMKEAHRVVTKTPEMSKAYDPIAKSEKTTAADKEQISDLLNLGQRLIFFAIVCALILSVVVAGLVVISSPKLVSSKNRF